MNQISRPKQEIANRKIAADQLINFAANVPSEHLRRVAELRGLLSEWGRINGLAHWWSINLAARFGSGGGNPALEAWQQGQTNEFSYRLTAAIVDWQDQMFNCLQMSWPYQEKLVSEYKDISTDAPTNEIDLFLLVLREIYDQQMQMSFSDHTTKARNVIGQMKQARDTFWAVGGGVRVDNQSLVELCAQDTERLFWYSLSMGNVLTASKQDLPLLSQYRRYLKSFGDFCDMMQARGTTELKGRVPQQEKVFCSVQIKDGVKRLGTKGGFKSVI